MVCQSPRTAFELGVYQCDSEVPVTEKKILFLTYDTSASATRLASWSKVRIS